LDGIPKFRVPGAELGSASKLVFCTSGMPEQCKRAAPNDVPSGIRPRSSTLDQLAGLAVVKLTLDPIEFQLDV
jgi:hypothetical protein